MFVENGCQSPKISCKILLYFTHFKFLNCYRISVENVSKKKEILKNFKEP